MEAIQSFFQKISQRGLNFSVGGSTVAPNLLQALGIVVFVFLLLLVIAKMTRGYMSWYTMGWYIWVALGFLLAMAVEGLFIVHGSTVLTEAFGWKNAPKPISTALDIGRERLVNVLGEKDEISTTESVISIYQSLSPDDTEKVRSMICTP